MFTMLSCSQRALILVLEYVGNFGARLPPGCSRYGVRASCSCVRMLSLYATGWPVFPKCMQLTLVRWYVASMLCRAGFLVRLTLPSYGRLHALRHPLHRVVLVSAGATYCIPGHILHVQNIRQELDAHPSEPIIRIINSSLCSGAVPPQFKQAVVTPLSVKSALHLRPKS